MHLDYGQGRGNPKCVAKAELTTVQGRVKGLSKQIQYGVGTDGMVLGTWFYYSNRKVIKTMHDSVLFLA